MQQVKDFFQRRMALLLACVMVLSMMPVTAFAAQTPTEEGAETSAVPETAVPMSTTYTGENGVVYTLYDDHAEVTGYDGYNSEVVILAEVEGVPVTVLRASAFSGIWGSFTNVVLPEGLTTIEESAFSWCSTLQSISIPESVTTLGEHTFLQCDALTSIDLPDGLITLGEGVFYGCDALTSIDFPESLTTIGRSAFGLCTGLTSVVIPAAVTEIGSNAFKSCTNLHTVTVSAQNRVYSSKDGILYRDSGTRLVWCPAGRSDSVSIPSSVVAIEPNAFFDCDKLTSVTIPTSVTSIGSYAFYNCDGLTSVTIPGGVASIGSNAFYTCSGLASVTILDGVADIKDYAFGYCRNLTAIDIPESVASIGWGVFCGCSSLVSLDWPGASSSIPGYAMEDCSSLKTLTIPHSVTQIGYGATLGCNSLADVYYDGTRSEWSQVSIDSQNWGVRNPTIHFNDGTTSNDPEPHDTLDALTELDYLAFSKLAYKNLDQYIGKTVQEVIGSNWKAFWTDGTTTEFLNSEIYGSIANWTVYQTQTGEDGFYSVAFKGPNVGQAVLAYRGSENLVKIFEGNQDAIGDWIFNDFPMLLGGYIGTQFKKACSAYTTLASDPEIWMVATTGHSLGGAWADAIAALYGCDGVSMNAVPILDVVYDTYPQLYGATFTGLSDWNFVDHANIKDILAGVNEAVFSSSPLKPFVGHESTYTGANPITAHSLWTMVRRNSDGKVSISDEKIISIPNAAMTQERKLSYVSLGSTGDDTLNKGMKSLKRQSAYGGNGADKIYTGVSWDKLVGGTGHDIMDAGYGDDTYFYFKGDGHDYIRDISGSDAVFLYGFTTEDSIEIVEDEDAGIIDIICNGESIVSIFKDGREYKSYTLDKFEVFVVWDTNNYDTYDITSFFSTKKYGSHIIVSCPVSVEIRDTDDNVVFTLTDGETGSWYTDYGNFYVFEEEDGGYGKVLDLVEGYTARIVGAGEGTMDVTYQVPVDGELTDPVSVTEVPVTDSLVATIEEDEENNVYLVIDADGDGAADEQLLLEAEHVHEWDEGTVTKEATCTEVGEIIYTCSGCEETMTETVEAKGHSYEAVVTEPTCTEQGYTTYTCAACGDSYVSDYVDAGHRYADGICTGCGKVETIVAYTQASLSLAGDIGVNYYVKLSSDIVADEGAYMQFTVAGQTQTIPLKEAEVGADGTYRFSCKVAAKQMTELITGQIYLSDGTAVGAAKTYSVKAYCDAAIPFYSQDADYAELVALMKAMMNYGGYSQVQFGYNTDNLANAGLDLPLPVPTEEDVSFYANYAQGSEDGISVSSASLLLESTTTIRFYFELDGSKSIESYTFCVDGEETAPVQVSENLYYVDKVNVAARDLDHMATVTVGGLTARYCGLSYVRQVAVLNSASYSENLVNVAKALYAYNQAANAYFE